MGVSTDAQLYYGIQFPEGYEFPWDADEYEGEEAYWWEVVQGYKRLHDLDWLKGAPDHGPHLGDRLATDEEIRDQFAHAREWKKANPMPVELVYHCHYEYRMYALAIPGTVTVARRGYPQDVTGIQGAPDYDPAAYEGLIAFIERYLTDLDEIDLVPRWWLSSYWG